MRRLAAAVIAALARVSGDRHHYVSTACQHGLHERCRQECKFCATPCQCPHHRKGERS